MVFGHSLRLPALVGLAFVALVGQPAVGETAAKRLAVLEFRGKIESDALETFADAVRGGAVEGLSGREVDVMTRENMMVLIREMGKIDCSEGDCDVETARNIGADFVVSGTVARIDDVFVVTLKLHETRRGTLLASLQIDDKTQLDVLRQLREQGRRLAAINIGSPPTPSSAQTPPMAHAPTVGPPPAAEPTSRAASPVVARREAELTQPSSASSGAGMRIAGLATMVVGVAGIATGVILNIKANGMANDLEASSTSYSRNKESSRASYETFGWVGYGVGAACLVGGAVLYYLGRGQGHSTQVALVPAVAPGQVAAVLQGAF
jgi:TolB-like protein